ncbi:MAG: ribosome recycling factor [Deltaproteobacteria bacterium]|nr:ribosome recycling factor [Deltaproteobacteria bacterium]
MSEAVLKQAESGMEKSLSALRAELSKVRTGRASTSLLEDVQVEYYGSPTPINQVATLSAPEPRLLTVSPWDASVIPLIEKAIVASDLGLTPSNDGKLIRIPIPALTEERRKDLVKLVKKYGEEAKVAVRHHRREAMDKLKKLEKDKELSEDDGKRLEEKIQKLTDSFVSKVDQILEKKEKDILEV